VGQHVLPHGAVPAAQQVVPPTHWPVGQQMLPHGAVPAAQQVVPPAHWPMGQQVLPQTWAFGQHTPPTQVVPAAQQTVAPATTQTWAVGQQAPLRQVVVAVGQHTAVVPPPQMTVPAGHTAHTGPAALPGGGHSVPAGQQTPCTSTVGQQVWPVRQP